MEEFTYVKYTSHTSIFVHMQDAGRQRFNIYWIPRGSSVAGNLAVCIGGHGLLKIAPREYLGAGGLLQQQCFTEVINEAQNRSDEEIVTERFQVIALEQPGKLRRCDCIIIIIIIISIIITTTTITTTTIGLSPGGSSPTLLQTKIKIRKTTK